MRRWMVAALLLASVSAHAQAPVTAQAADIERLQAAVVATMPVGEIIEAVAAEDPRWPIQDKPQAMNERQLACFRQNMTKSQYQTVVAERVAQYAETNPARVASDARFLATSGGLFVRIMHATISARGDSSALDTNSIIAAAKPEEVLGMMSLVSDSQYRPLRELMGLPDDFLARDGSEIAQTLSTTFMMPMMFKAFSTCDVPMSALFE